MVSEYCVNTYVSVDYCDWNTRLLGPVPASDLVVEKRVLVREPDTAAERAPRKPVAPWPLAMVYLAVGCIGVVLALAALVDYVLALVPMRFGVAEWEIGTISQIFFGLPLVSLGLAAIWISGAGAGRRWVLLGVGTVFFAAAVVLAMMLLLFALDIPLALRATSETAARLGLKKLIAKTVILGLLFGVSYVVAGLMALRQLRRSNSMEVGI